MYDRQGKKSPIDIPMAALDIVDTLVKSSAVDIVVVDSVAALVPKAELEGEMGDHHIALQVLSLTHGLFYDVT